MNALWRVSKKESDEIRWDNSIAQVRSRLFRVPDKNVARKEDRNESRGPDNRAIRKALLRATLLWLQSMCFATNLVNL